MSDANAGVGFSAALSEQIMSEDASALEAAVTGKDGEEAAPETAKEEEAPEGDKSTESSEEDAKPEDSEESEETAEETEEAKKEDEPKTYKVGNKEFSDIQEVIKEANSVIGAKGQLEGELKTAKARTSELEATNQELAKLNKQWVDWYNANIRGDVAAEDEGEEAPVEKKPAPSEQKLDKDALKKELKEELLHEQNVEKLMDMFRAQVADIRATSHASQVESYLEVLADKINPETDNYFSPIEAYEYACRKLGLTPELGEGATKAAPKEPPKKTANTAAMKSAARPGSSAAPAPTKKVDRTPVDDALNAAFPLL